MILIHIVTDNQKQAEDISEFLISKKLLAEVLIMNVIQRKLAKQKSATLQPHYLILGKSKALLFDDIDKSLRDRYG